MRFRFAVLLLLGATCCAPRISASAESLGADRAARSCAGFVQHYYNWYRALAARDTPGPTVMTAIRRRPHLLSGALREALQVDRAAEVRNRSGYIVGIDFDPVLSGSDFADRYVTQRVTRRKNTYLVEVCGIFESRKHPPIIAEVVRWKGNWVFLNFHYPNDRGTGFNDLRTMLKEQARDRRTGRV